MDGVDTVVSKITCSDFKALCDQELYFASKASTLDKDLRELDDFLQWITDLKEDPDKSPEPPSSKKEEWKYNPVNGRNDLAIINEWESPRIVGAYIDKLKAAWNHNIDVCVRIDHFFVYCWPKIKSLKPDIKIEDYKIKLIKGKRRIYYKHANSQRETLDEIKNKRKFPRW